MTSPHSELRFEDLQSLTLSLLSCGARIDEINTLRRHLDRVKGDGIAKSAYPAQVASLILSDVVENPLEAIASGPTVPDPSIKTDALDILRKYKLIGKFLNSVVRFLNDAPETPKVYMNAKHSLPEKYNYATLTNLLPEMTFKTSGRLSRWECKFNPSN